MLTRRTMLAAASAGLLTANEAGGRYRAVIIGHTGRGGYGHGWEMMWNRVPAVEVVAVADPDEKGRTEAMARANAPRGYADYREMIRKEKPQLVTIASRWADQHLAMLTAAAEAGAHAVIEKPFAPDLPTADRMVETAARHKIKVQVGHIIRASAFRVREMVAGGEIGQLVEMRARGKEDARAGGEDLIVLGSHALDLMRFIAGDPRWVFANVLQDGREIRRSDAHSGKEMVGRFAGNDITATFGFDNGIHGHFASKAVTPNPPGNRCGLWLYGSKGVIFINQGNSRTAEGRILRSPYWMEEKDKAEWTPLSTAGPERDGNWDRANNLMALDLLDAIEQRRKPLCDAGDGRWTMEMVAGIYHSQRTGSRVRFPLTDRGDPLDLLPA
ncbi:MAG: Gfo/Idh/MocA family oxidoreductase [Acidobacteria bacterium]|nr:Gfo/Idh/MocA family oxidoreductase [Acidobacteriota bacterium]